MEVPYKMLSEQALRGVIEEFVSREGTDYGDRIYSLDEKVKHVMGQLVRGEASIVFDQETETCSIVGAEQLRWALLTPEDD